MAATGAAFGMEFVGPGPAAGLGPVAGPGCAAGFGSAQSFGPAQVTHSLVSRTNFPVRS